MDKDGLPPYTPTYETGNPRRQRNRRRRFARILVLVLACYALYCYWHPKPLYTRVDTATSRSLSVEKLRKDHATCATLRSKPKDPSGEREKNARWNGGSATLIKNTTIWTGEPLTNGSYVWQSGDVLLSRGLIAHISPIPLSPPADAEVVDGSGRLLTAGIVDMHSHAGDYPLPAKWGDSDGNELSSDITPYVRSLDAVNPLDPQIRVIKSGGVTASLVLPGSGNNIGGEAYVLKHAVGPRDGRPEISAEDMLADPSRTWRYMKMACGENAKRVYGQVGRSYGPFSRMGEAWYFRHAFERARALVRAQDDWCAAADQVGAEGMQEYLPWDLEWESLGAVLRGHVHVNTHCYTIPDLEAFIRHTNEFEFPVRAFHHAHQTYLVPEILKRNYGGVAPAAALFADNMYYKVESYVASEQAGKILHENGITPVYVSDNPVINAQHVVFEAAKAYRNGLPYHVALAGVTSAPARLLGMQERFGKVKKGLDADVVLWDSDPLSVGATPVQVWTDGAVQFDDPILLGKSAATPLGDGKLSAPVSETPETHENVLFRGVTRVLLPGREQNSSTPLDVLATRGKISCIGSCAASTPSLSSLHTVNLTAGHLVPPALSFGSFLGLVEIAGENTANDGPNTPSSYSAALDGLSLGTKALRAAYTHGVTRAISAPPFHAGGHKGSSVAFRTNALHALEEVAVVKGKASVHVPLTLGVKEGATTPSLSSAIAALRAKLLKALDANVTSSPAAYDQETHDLSLVVAGNLPLVVTVHAASTIASLLSLLSSLPPHAIRLTIMGGAEAHLLAPQLAASNVSVVLAPVYPYAETWDQRRSLTGAPLTDGTAVDVLHDAGVEVVLGTAEDWETRNLYLSAGIAAANSGGKISEAEAYGMIGGNIYAMLGLEPDTEGWVVSEGDPLSIQGSVRAVGNGIGGVDVFMFEQ